MLKKILFLNWRKATALLMSGLFLLETAAWAAPAPINEVIRNAYNVQRSEVQVQSFVEQVRIPSSLGQVTDAYDAIRSTNDVVLFHIEDAHGEPEAQKNTQAILEHLKKEYSIRTFFLEGAWSKLDPTLMHISTDAAQNKKILEELTEKGIVGGPENFLYENFKNNKEGQAAATSSLSFPRRRESSRERLDPRLRGDDKQNTHQSFEQSNSFVKGYGIEDLRLYKKNLGEFRAVMGAKTESDVFLAQMKTGLLTKASQVLNPELAEYFRNWSFQEEIQTDYSAHLRVLAATAQKHLALDLNDPREQYDWPMLTRFFKLKELEKNKEQGTKDKEKFLGWLHHQNLRNYTDCFDSQSLFFVPCSLSQESGARQFFESFYEKASPRGFKFKDYPALSKIWGKQILMQEFDAPTLVKEIQSLESRLIEKLAQTPSEKKLIAKYREYLLLRKLLRLELSKEEWQQFQTNDQRLSTTDLGRGSVPSEARGLTPLVSKIVTRAKQFYETAEARDAAMFARTVDWIKKEKIEKAAIITGGFHSEGMAKFFKEKNISYLRIQPRITQVHGRENYLKLMTAGSTLRAMSRAEARPLADMDKFYLAEIHRASREIRPKNRSSFGNDQRRSESRKAKHRIEVSFSPKKNLRQISLFDPEGRQILLDGKQYLLSNGEFFFREWIFVHSKGKILRLNVQTGEVQNSNTDWEKLNRIFSFYLDEKSGLLVVKLSNWHIALYDPASGKAVLTPEDSKKNKMYASHHHFIQAGVLVVFDPRWQVSIYDIKKRRVIPVKEEEKIMQAPQRRGPYLAGENGAEIHVLHLPTGNRALLNGNESAMGQAPQFRGNRHLSVTPWAVPNSAPAAEEIYKITLPEMSRPEMRRAVDLPAAGGEIKISPRDKVLGAIARIKQAIASFVAADKRIITNALEIAHSNNLSDLVVELNRLSEIWDKVLYLQTVYLMPARDIKRTIDEQIQLEILTADFLKQKKDELRALKERLLKVKAEKSEEKAAIKRAGRLIGEIEKQWPDYQAKVVVLKTAKAQAIPQTVDLTKTWEKVRATIIKIQAGLKKPASVFVRLPQQDTRRAIQAVTVSATVPPVKEHYRFKRVIDSYESALAARRKQIYTIEAATNFERALLVELISPYVADAGFSDDIRMRINFGEVDDDTGKTLEGILEDHLAKGQIKDEWVDEFLLRLEPGMRKLAKVPAQFVRWQQSGDMTPDGIRDQTRAAIPVLERMLKDLFKDRNATLISPRPLKQKGGSPSAQYKKWATAQIEERQREESFKKEREEKSRPEMRSKIIFDELKVSFSTEGEGVTILSPIQRDLLGVAAGQRYVPEIRMAPLLFQNDSERQVLDGVINSQIEGGKYYVFFMEDEGETHPIAMGKLREMSVLDVTSISLAKVLMTFPGIAHLEILARRVSGQAIDPATLLGENQPLRILESVVFAPNNIWHAAFDRLTMSAVSPLLAVSPYTYDTGIVRSPQIAVYDGDREGQKQLGIRYISERSPYLIKPLNVAMTSEGSVDLPRLSSETNPTEWGELPILNSTSNQEALDAVAKAVGLKHILFKPDNFPPYGSPRVVVFDSGGRNVRIAGISFYYLLEGKQYFIQFADEKLPVEEYAARLSQKRHQVVHFKKDENWLTASIGEGELGFPDGPPNGFFSFELFFPSPVRNEARLQGVTKEMPVWYFLQAFGIDPDISQVTPLKGGWGRVELGQYPPQIKIHGLSDIRKAAEESLRNVMIADHLKRVFRGGAKPRDAFLLTYQNVPQALVWKNVGHKKETVFFPIRSNVHDDFFGAQSQVMNQGAAKIEREMRFFLRDIDPEILTQAPASGPAAREAQAAAVKGLLARLDAMTMSDATSTGLLKILDQLALSSKEGYLFPTVYPPDSATTDMTLKRLKLFVKEGKINPAESVVVDVGSGGGALTEEMIRQGFKTVHAVDIRLLPLLNTALRLAHARLQKRNPLPDASVIFHLRELPPADLYVMNGPNFVDDDRSFQASPGAEKNFGISEAEYKQLFQKAAKQARTGAHFLIRLFLRKNQIEKFTEMVQAAGWTVESQEDLGQAKEEVYDRTQLQKVFILKKRNEMRFQSHAGQPEFPPVWRKARPFIVGVYRLFRLIAGVKVEGLANLPNRPYFLVANHFSLLDGFILAFEIYLRTGRLVRFVAKPGYLGWWQRFLVNKLGLAFLLPPRNNRPIETYVGEVADLMKREVEKGWSIGIFPSGEIKINAKHTFQGPYRNHQAESWRDTVAKAAIAGNIPIVPVAISGKIQRKKMLASIFLGLIGFKRGVQFNAVVLAPVETVGQTPDDVMEKLKFRLSAMLQTKTINGKHVPAYSKPAADSVKQAVSYIVPPDAKFAKPATPVKEKELSTAELLEREKAFFHKSEASHFLDLFLDVSEKLIRNWKFYDNVRAPGRLIALMVLGWFGFGSVAAALLFLVNLKIAVPLILGLAVVVKLLQRENTELYFSRAFEHIQTPLIRDYSAWREKRYQYLKQLIKKLWDEKEAGELQEDFNLLWPRQIWVLLRILSRTDNLKINKVIITLPDLILRLHALETKINQSGTPIARSTRQTAFEIDVILYDLLKMTLLILQAGKNPEKIWQFEKLIQNLSKKTAQLEAVFHIQARTEMRTGNAPPVVAQENQRAELEAQEDLRAIQVLRAAAVKAFAQAHAKSNQGKTTFSPKELAEIFDGVLVEILHESKMPGKRAFVESFLRLWKDEDPAKEPYASEPELKFLIARARYQAEKKDPVAPGILRRGFLKLTTRSLLSFAFGGSTNIGKLIAGELNLQFQISRWVEEIPGAWNQHARDGVFLSHFTYPEYVRRSQQSLLQPGLSAVLQQEIRRDPGHFLAMHQRWENAGRPRSNGEGVEMGGVFIPSASNTPDFNRQVYQVGRGVIGAFEAAERALPWKQVRDLKNPVELPRTLQKEKKSIQRELRVLLLDPAANAYFQHVIEHANSEPQDEADRREKLKWDEWLEKYSRLKKRAEFNEEAIVAWEKSEKTTQRFKHLPLGSFFSRKPQTSAAKIIPFVVAGAAIITGANFRHCRVRAEMRAIRWSLDVNESFEMFVKSLQALKEADLAKKHKIAVESNRASISFDLGGGQRITVKGDASGVHVSVTTMTAKVPMTFQLNSRFFLGLDYSRNQKRREYFSLKVRGEEGQPDAMQPILNGFVEKLENLQLIAVDSKLWSWIKAKRSKKWKIEKFFTEGSHVGGFSKTRASKWRKEFGFQNASQFIDGWHSTASGEARAGRKIFSLAVVDDDQFNAVFYEYNSTGQPVAHFALNFSPGLLVLQNWAHGPGASIHRIKSDPLIVFDSRQAHFKLQMHPQNYAQVLRYLDEYPVTPGLKEFISHYLLRAENRSTSPVSNIAAAVKTGAYKSIDQGEALVARAKKGEAAMIPEAFRMLAADHNELLYPFAITALKSFPDQERIARLLKGTVQAQSRNYTSGNYARMAGYISKNDPTRFARYKKITRTSILIELFPQYISYLHNLKDVGDRDAIERIASLKKSFQTLLRESAGKDKEFGKETKAARNGFIVPVSQRAKVLKAVLEHQIVSAEELIPITGLEKGTNQRTLTGYVGTDGSIHPGVYEIFVHALLKTNSEILKEIERTFNERYPAQVIHKVIDLFFVDESPLKDVDAERKYLAGVVEKLAAKKDDGLYLSKRAKPKLLEIIRAKKPQTHSRGEPRHDWVYADAADHTITSRDVLNRVTRLLMAEPATPNPIRIAQVRNTNRYPPLRTGKFVYRQPEQSTFQFIVEPVTDQTDSKILHFREDQNTAIRRSKAEQIIALAFDYYEKNNELPAVDFLARQMGITPATLFEIYINTVIQGLKSRRIIRKATTWKEARKEILTRPTFRIIKGAENAADGIDEVRQRFEKGKSIQIQKMEFYETGQGLRLYMEHVDYFGKRDSDIYEFPGVQLSAQKQKSNLFELFENAGYAMPLIAGRGEIELKGRRYLIAKYLESIGKDIQEVRFEYLPASANTEPRIEVSEAYGARRALGTLALDQNLNPVNPATLQPQKMAASKSIQFFAFVQDRRPAREITLTEENVIVFEKTSFEANEFLRHEELNPNDVRVLLYHVPGSKNSEMSVVTFSPTSDREISLLHFEVNAQGRPQNIPGLENAEIYSLQRIAEAVNAAADSNRHEASQVIAEPVIGRPLAIGRSGKFNLNGVHYDLSALFNANPDLSLAETKVVVFERQDNPRIEIKISGAPVQVIQLNQNDRPFVFENLTARAANVSVASILRLQENSTDEKLFKTTLKTKREKVIRAPRVRSPRPPRARVPRPAREKKTRAVREKQGKKIEIKSPAPAELWRSMQGGKKALDDDELRALWDQRNEKEGVYENLLNALLPLIEEKLKLLASREGSWVYNDGLGEAFLIVDEILSNWKPRKKKFSLSAEVKRRLDKNLLRRIRKVSQWTGGTSLDAHVMTKNGKGDTVLNLIDPDDLHPALADWTAYSGDDKEWMFFDDEGRDYAHAEMRQLPQAGFDAVGTSAGNGAGVGDAIPVTRHLGGANGNTVGLQRGLVPGGLNGRALNGNLASQLDSAKKEISFEEASLLADQLVLKPTTFAVAEQNIVLIRKLATMKKVDHDQVDAIAWKVGKFLSIKNIYHAPTEELTEQTRREALHFFDSIPNRVGLVYLRGGEDDGEAEPMGLIMPGRYATEPFLSQLGVLKTGMILKYGSDQQKLKAADALVRNYSRLVVKIAYKYYRPSALAIPFEEFVHLGQVELSHAFESWDPTVSSFAYFKLVLNRHYYTIQYDLEGMRITPHEHAEYNKLKRRLARLQLNIQDPTLTNGEIERKIRHQLTRAQIARIRLVGFRMNSMDRPVEGKDGDSGRVFGDSFYVDPVESEDHADQRTRLLNKLFVEAEHLMRTTTRIEKPEMHIAITKARFFEDPRPELAELAKRFGLNNHQRAGQMITLMIKYLRMAAEKAGISARNIFNEDAADAPPRGIRDGRAEMRKRVLTPLEAEKKAEKEKKGLDLLKMGRTQTKEIFIQALADLPLKDVSDLKFIVEIIHQLILTLKTASKRSKAHKNYSAGLKFLRNRVKTFISTLKFDFTGITIPAIASSAQPEHTPGVYSGRRGEMRHKAQGRRAFSVGSDSKLYKIMQVEIERKRLADAADPKGIVWSLLTLGDLDKRPLLERIEREGIGGFSPEQIEVIHTRRFLKREFYFPPLAGYEDAILSAGAELETWDDGFGRVQFHETGFYAERFVRAIQDARNTNKLLIIIGDHQIELFEGIAEEASGHDPDFVYAEGSPRFLKSLPARMRPICYREIDIFSIDHPRQFWIALGFGLLTFVNYFYPVLISPKEISTVWGKFFSAAANDLSALSWIVGSMLVLRMYKKEGKIFIPVEHFFVIALQLFLAVLNSLIFFAGWNDPQQLARGAGGLVGVTGSFFINHASFGLAREAVVNWSKKAREYIENKKDRAEMRRWGPITLLKNQPQASEGVNFELYSEGTGGELFGLAWDGAGYYFRIGVQVDEKWQACHLNSGQNKELQVRLTYNSSEGHFQLEAREVPFLNAMQRQELAAELRGHFKVENSGERYQFWREKIYHTASPTEGFNEILIRISQNQHAPLKMEDAFDILERLNQILRAESPAAYPWTEMGEQMVHFLALYNAVFRAHLEEAASYIEDSEHRKIWQNLFDVHSLLNGLAVIRAKLEVLPNSLPEQHLENLTSLIKALDKVEDIMNAMDVLLRIMKKYELEEELKRGIDPLQNLYDRYGEDLQDGEEKTALHNFVEQVPQAVINDHVRNSISGAYDFWVQYQSHFQTMSDWIRPQLETALKQAQAEDVRRRPSPLQLKILDGKSTVTTEVVPPHLGSPQSKTGFKENLKWAENLRQQGNIDAATIPSFPRIPVWLAVLVQLLRGKKTIVPLLNPLVWIFRPIGFLMECLPFEWAKKITFYWKSANVYERPWEVSGRPQPYMATVAAHFYDLNEIKEQISKAAEQGAEILFFVGGGHPFRRIKWLRKFVRPVETWEMIRLAKQMQAGGEISKSIVIAASWNPYEELRQPGSLEPNFARGLGDLQRKQEAGATVIFTQPPILRDEFMAWFSEIAKHDWADNLQFKIGMTYVRSAADLKYWFGLMNVPDHHPEAASLLRQFERAEEEGRLATFAWNWNVSRFKDIARLPVPYGIHLMIFGEIPSYDRFWNETGLDAKSHEEANTDGALRVQNKTRQFVRRMLRLKYPVKMSYSRKLADLQVFPETERAMAGVEKVLNDSYAQATVPDWMKNLRLQLTRIPFEAAKSSGNFKSMHDPIEIHTSNEGWSELVINVSAFQSVEALEESLRTCLSGWTRLAQNEIALQKRKPYEQSIAHDFSRLIWTNFESFSANVKKLKKVEIDLKDEWVAQNAKDFVQQLLNSRPGEEEVAYVELSVSTIKRAKKFVAQVFAEAQVLSPAQKKRLKSKKIMYVFADYSEQTLEKLRTSYADLKDDDIFHEQATALNMSFDFRRVNAVHPEESLGDLKGKILIVHSTNLYESLPSGYAAKFGTRVYRVLTEVKVSEADAHTLAERYGVDEADLKKRLYHIAETPDGVQALFDHYQAQLGDRVYSLIIDLVECMKLRDHYERWPEAPEHSEAGQHDVIFRDVLDAYPANVWVPESRMSMESITKLMPLLYPAIGILQMMQMTTSIAAIRDQYQGQRNMAGAMIMPVAIDLVHATAERLGYEMEIKPAPAKQVQVIELKVFPRYLITSEKHQAILKKLKEAGFNSKTFSVVLKKLLIRLGGKLFVLGRGMVYGALDTFWGHGHTRLRSFGGSRHQSSDLAVMQDLAGNRSTMPVGTPIPAFFQKGKAHWFFNDSMRQSVAFKHPAKIKMNGKSYAVMSVYMHLDLDPAIQVGRVIGLGRIVGKTAFSRHHPQSPVAPHAHIGIALVEDEVLEKFPAGKYEEDIFHPLKPYEDNGQIIWIDFLELLSAEDRAAMFVEGEAATPGFQSLAVIHPDAKVGKDSMLHLGRNFPGVAVYWFAQETDFQAWHSQHPESPVAVFAPNSPEKLRSGDHFFKINQVGDIDAVVQQVRNADREIRLAKNRSEMRIASGGIDIYHAVERSEERSTSAATHLGNIYRELMKIYIEVYQAAIKAKRDAGEAAKLYQNAKMALDKFNKNNPHFRKRELKDLWSKVIDSTKKASEQLGQKNNPNAVAAILIGPAMKVQEMYFQYLAHKIPPLPEDGRRRSDIIYEPNSEKYFVVQGVYSKEQVAGELVSNLHAEDKGFDSLWEARRGAGEHQIESELKQLVVWKGWQAFLTEAEKQGAEWIAQNLPAKRVALGAARWLVDKEILFLLADAGMLQLEAGLDASFQNSTLGLLKSFTEKRIEILEKMTERLKKKRFADLTFMAKFRNRDALYKVRKLKKIMENVTYHKGGWRHNEPQKASVLGVFWGASTDILEDILPTGDREPDLHGVLGFVQRAREHFERKDESNSEVNRREILWALSQAEAILINSEITQNFIADFVAAEIDRVKNGLDLEAARQAAFKQIFSKFLLDTHWENGIYQQRTWLYRLYRDVFMSPYLKRKKPKAARPANPLYQAMTLVVKLMDIQHGAQLFKAQIPQPIKIWLKAHLSKQANLVNLPAKKKQELWALIEKTYDLQEGALPKLMLKDYRSENRPISNGIALKARLPAAGFKSTVEVARDLTETLLPVKFVEAMTRAEFKRVYSTYFGVAHEPSGLEALKLSLRDLVVLSPDLAGAKCFLSNPKILGAQTFAVYEPDVLKREKLDVLIKQNGLAQQGFIFGTKVEFQQQVQRFFEKTSIHSLVLMGADDTFETRAWLKQIGDPWTLSDKRIEKMFLGLGLDELSAQVFGSRQVLSAA